MDFWEVIGLESLLGKVLSTVCQKQNYMSLTFLRTIGFFYLVKRRGRYFLRLPKGVSFNIGQAALLSWEFNGVMVGSALILACVG